jgi:hypothetical protein
VNVEREQYAMARALRIRVGLDRGSWAAERGSLYI